MCGRGSVQVRMRDAGALDLEALAHRLSPLGRVEKNRYLVRAWIDDVQLTVFADGRAIVGGTNDPVVAKSVYSRYVGM